MGGVFSPERKRGTSFVAENFTKGDMSRPYNTAVGHFPKKKILKTPKWDMSGPYNTAVGQTIPDSLNLPFVGNPRNKVVSPISFGRILSNTCFEVHYV